MARTSILSIKILSDATAASKGFDEAERRATRFGTALKGAFAVVGVAGVVKGVQSVVSASSDLNESANAVNVTYGKQAKAIADLGKNSAKGLGLSTSEFNSMAVQFSSFAKTVGGGGKGSVKVIDDLTKRSADFASVMNMDVADSAAAFQSALAGETEPLKKYGINISDAATKAYAYANGIAASGKPLTDAQKVQARYGLIMQETAKTQGDFANTSDSAANAQRIAAAQVENFKAKLGAGLLPIIAKVASFIGETLVPALETFFGFLKTGDPAALGKLFGMPTDSGLLLFLTQVRDAAITAFGALRDNALPVLASIGAGIAAFAQSDAFGPIAVGIAAIVAAMTAWNVITKVIAISQAALNIVLSANPIGAFILLIVGLIAAITYLWKNNETFRTKVIEVWGAVKSFMSSAAEFIKNALSKAWDFIKNLLKWSPLGIIVQLWGPVKDKLTEPFKAAKDKISDIFSSIKDTVSGAFDNVKRVINGAIAIANKVITTANKLPGVDVPTIPTIGRSIAGLGGGGTAINLVRVNIAGREVQAVVDDSTSRARSSMALLDVMGARA